MLISSDRASHQTLEEFERHLWFERVYNFRDLGGYPTRDGRRTRWRTVFRSDGLYRMNPEDLVPLGVRCVIDLRTTGELEDQGKFAADGIEYHHQPVLKAVWEKMPEGDPRPMEQILADLYLDMLVQGPSAIGATLRLLADPDRAPAVFHCAAGKDRTGVVAAVLLSLLGVDDDVIVADYALSQHATDRLIARFRVEEPERAKAIEDNPTLYFSTPAESMHVFLDELRERHGSVEAAADEIFGVDETVVRDLQAHLLDD